MKKQERGYKKIRPLKPSPCKPLGNVVYVVGRSLRVAVGAGRLFLAERVPPCVDMPPDHDPFTDAILPHVLLPVPKLGTKDRVEVLLRVVTLLGTNVRKLLALELLNGFGIDDRHLGPTESVHIIVVSQQMGAAVHVDGALHLGATEKLVHVVLDVLEELDVVLQCRLVVDTVKDCGGLVHREPRHKQLNHRQRDGRVHPCLLFVATVVVVGRVTNVRPPTLLRSGVRVTGLGVEEENEHTDHPELGHVEAAHQVLTLRDDPDHTYGPGDQPDDSRREGHNHNVKPATIELRATNTPQTDSREYLHEDVNEENDCPL
eukprot:Hpha_TRINITY_DN15282_c4_g4::TRINITY_DN15282_c4_g4_i1::g.66694::m.66694